MRHDRQGSGLGAGTEAIRCFRRSVRPIRSPGWVSAVHAVTGTRCTARTRAASKRGAGRRSTTAGPAIACPARTKVFSERNVRGYVQVWTYGGSIAKWLDIRDVRITLVYGILK